MTRRSMISGVWVGLLLTLTGLYPAFYLFVGRVVIEIGNHLQRQFGNFKIGVLDVPVSQIVLLVTTGICMMLLLLVGSIPTLRSGARGIKQGVKFGVIGSMVAGLTVYFMLIAPTSAIVAGKDLFAHRLSVMAAQYPEHMVVNFARDVIVVAPGRMLITLALFALVGAVEGGLVGFLRRTQDPAKRPTALLDVPSTLRGHAAWFAESQEALVSGALTGLALGALMMLASIWAIANASGATAEEMWLMDVTQKALAGTPIGRMMDTLIANLLVPMVFVLGTVAGGLAAFFPKNPPGRLGPRVVAAALAGAVSGMIFGIALSDQTRFALIISNQFMYSNLISVQVDPSMPWELGEFMTVLATAPIRTLLVYLVPLPTTFGVTLAGTILGALQGLIFSLIFMAVNLRPTDRAYKVRRELEQHPEVFLPRVYKLFQNSPMALAVLEHLYFGLRREPTKARLIGAFHTIATAPTRAADALEASATILSEQTGWKQHAEIAALHRILARGLKARTIAQLAAIQPMPEDQTTSLPQPLAKAGEFVSQIISEVKKIERVDDLSAKIIFLNNTLETLRQGRIFLEATKKQDCCASTYPELIAFHAFLDQTSELALAGVRDIQGCADLISELKTRTLTTAENQTLTVVLKNQGLNVAENIRLQVDDAPGLYTVVEGGQQTVAILTSQEPREFSLTIRPLKNEPLRVSWRIVYDDALNKDRVLDFGDQIDFMDAQGSFQRIFPIPYVTGTPLQTGEMFVGRDDIFEFVRENLFGTYQNNVIVLHGQRRTGKSSVLYHLNDVLKESHICVLIDMQGKAARGEVDFLYSIADDIVYTLENHGITAPLPERSEFEDSPEFFFRSRFLRGVYEALGEKNLLLMFDEFEELQKRVEDGKLSADIFPYLRNLMQHERRLDFIFAGTHKLEELASEYWSILFNIAAYKRITFLDYDDVVQLVTKPVERYGLSYDPLALERIFQVASGHPYFTQVICHELVAYHNDTERNYITTTCVDAVLDRIIERGEAHFKYIWAESSMEQRLLLVALAELLETMDNATLDDIAGVLEKRGRAVETTDLNEAAGKLEARDILLRSGPRSNLYRFRVDLIRRWIYATRPAYEKIH
ncbi:MAG TPA: hypothetical protein PLT26_10060 [Anaerolineaceae bacterium]|nr:hypothetical protein [Anaerolineaceae bacterium]HQH85896.1 hypothetical protein [Anaerolineaceae bacterium]